MGKGVFYIFRVITLTAEKPHATNNIRKQPTNNSYFGVKNFDVYSSSSTTNPSVISAISPTNSSFSAGSSDLTLVDIPITIMHAKLPNIAITSKAEILSPSRHQARKQVQNGAVLKIVTLTTIGTIAIANVIDVRATVAHIDRYSSILLYSGGT